MVYDELSFLDFPLKVLVYEILSSITGGRFGSYSIERRSWKIDSDRTVLNDIELQK